MLTTPNPNPNQNPNPSPNPNKVIAMTCTHAAIKRRDLINLAFQYDNLVMEEAAQARTGVVPAAGASPGHLR